jgi:hypothetical protein
MLAIYDGLVHTLLIATLESPCALIMLNVVILLLIC